MSFNAKRASDPASTASDIAEETRRETHVRLRKNNEWRRVIQDFDERSADSQRALPLVKKAGFHDKAHYYAGGHDAKGRAAYCKCGTLQDHEQRYEELLGEAKRVAKSEPG